jgi:hypothetical protein
LIRAGIRDQRSEVEGQKLKKREKRKEKRGKRKGQGTGELPGCP